MPDLGPGQAGQVAGMFSVYSQTRTEVFVAALDQLMIITAVITLLGVGLALLLRSGPAPKAAPAERKAEPVVAEQVPEPVAEPQPEPVPAPTPARPRTRAGAPARERIPAVRR